METHDILIGAVIIIILSVQFAVFVVALKRINLFKKVIPRETSFRMVKVYIPESQIRSLSVNGILENESRYGETTTEDEQILLESEEVQLIDDVEEDDYLDKWDEEEHPETEIWVSKENDEKKIQYQFLKSHEASGWTRIHC